MTTIFTVILVNSGLMLMCDVHVIENINICSVHHCCSVGAGDVRLAWSCLELSILGLCASHLNIYTYGLLNTVHTYDYGMCAILIKLLTLIWTNLHYLLPFCLWWTFCRIQDSSKYKSKRCDYKKWSVCTRKENIYYILAGLPDNVNTEIRGVFIRTYRVSYIEPKLILLHLLGQTENIKT